MIPKVIHYCWFGGGEKPELIQQCIQSWHKYCPDYEIVEWNESNFDVTAHPFMKAAYDAKKWAFVSDVARLEILYLYGGIYLDTDVELKVDSPFNTFLEREAIFAFENERAINTGMCCGAAKGCSLLRELLIPYSHTDFNGDRIKHEYVNTVMNKPVFQQNLQLEWNDQHQVLNNIEIISTGMFNRIAIHYGTRTWDPEQARYTLHRKPYKDTKIKRYLRNPQKFKYIETHFGTGAILKIYTFLSYDLLELGPLYFARRLFKKLFRK